MAAKSLALHVYNQANTYLLVKEMSVALFVGQLENCGASDIWLMNISSFVDERPREIKEEEEVKVVNTEIIDLIQFD